MPSPDSYSTNLLNGKTNAEFQCERALQADGTRQLVTPEQLARMAKLVALGESPVPLHLSEEQLEVLVRDVRRRRHRRLVKFIARAIADDICQSSGQ